MSETTQAGPVPRGQRTWLNPMERAQIDQAIERLLRDAGWERASQDDAVMRPMVDLVAALIRDAEQRGAEKERERIAELRAAPAPGSVDHVWGVDAMGNRVAGFAREARATIRAVADSQSYRRGHIEEMAVRIIKGEQS